MACGFCESALANAVGTLVVDCVLKPVGRELDYVRRFHDNAKKLVEKKHELSMARDQLQHEDSVRDMLSKADNLLSDMETLEEEIKQNKRCFNWCPNWSWRYRLSKKAMKKTVDILELLEKLNKFGHPATNPLPTIEFMLSEDFDFSKSSKAAFDQIIEALQDDNISMIGLWGMGGVGKTTLVREVGSQAQKSNLFDKVAIATVSQKPNFEAIQDEIAKYIGFDMKNERARRSEQELWLRLKNEKRILIILDNVWTDINLKEIGIPFGEDHKSCKILLTTRLQHVCRTLNCQKVVPLDCLDGHEAWTLFAKKAGLNDSSDDAIKRVATKIIKKCEGLPIAIVTLGSALKGKDLHSWKAASLRLTNLQWIDIEDIDPKTYACLEVSFNYLNVRETKICFLLCSLFPGDHEISVEDLVRFAWGLELYKGINSIEDVRSLVLAAIGNLKDSRLLLDCGERHVKMHDVVRGAALWIASCKKELSFVIKSDVETWPKDESFEHYTAISFKTSQIVELPEGLVYPNLKILLLGGTYDSQMTTSSEFFEGMKALKVCALDNILLSPAAFQLTKLRTLHLKSCKLFDISLLGKLKTLQVLSFIWSDVIELPDGIGELENLRLLELSKCINLQRIPPHLIQRLSNLEELYLDHCNSIKWASGNATQEESYSSLSELNSLPKLAVLSLDISSEHLPKGFVFPKLQRFDVCIGVRREWASKNCPISRSLKIEASVLNACKQLFEDIESLELKELVGCRNLVPSMELKLELHQRGFNKLTSLHLRSCEDMKCLIDTSKQQTLTTAFSNLVNLSLRDMLGLEELCNGPQPQGFLQKLKTLSIFNCQQMISAVPILQNLEELNVESCDKMQVLFQIAELRSIQQEPSHLVSLQSLKVVEIDSCNNLKYLFPMSAANSLGQLETLKIKSCLGLEEIIQATEVSDISLQSLRKVHVEECNNLTSLSSLSHGQSLENLTALVIRDCFRLEYTFPISMAEGLPQLNEVCLVNLPQLKGRDENDIVLTLPSLNELEVENCPQLTSFIISAKIQVQVQQGPNHHVSFQSLGQLERLTIKCCLGLEEIIHATEVSNISLKSLKVVKIDNCNKLRYLFPMSIANSLGQLETLKIKSCLGLEEIIHATEVSNIGLRSLKVVKIDSCNELKYLFPKFVANSFGQLETLKIKSCLGLEGIIQATEVSNIGLRSLKVVEIDSCNNLKYLFPMSAANSLGQLETLKIRSCLGLEEIIQATEVSDISLQSLRKVYVAKCNNLTSLSSLSHGQSLESLTELMIWDCSRLEYTFPISMAEEGLPQLNEVHLENLPQFKGRDGNDIVLTLPSLQKLEVNNCPQLTPFIISAKIQELDFGGMRERKQMCNMIVPELSGRSANMEYLTITNFEDLFDSGYNLSSLKNLELKELPELRVIWKGPIQVVNFQNLTTLRVYVCRRLRYVFSPTIARNLPQLSCLIVSGCEELEQIIEKDQTSSQDHHHHLQPICFPNLTYIKIIECENLKCLFPVTVAHGGLPKLKRLEVSNVSKLEQVFEEGDEANVSMDKQKVIQLPQFNTLKLQQLPNLVSFSPVGYHFVFPSLHWLYVNGCPKITTSFSVDSKQSAHAETEASQSFDEIIVEESSTAPETTWSIGSDISWFKDRKMGKMFRMMKMKRKMKCSD